LSSRIRTGSVVRDKRDKVWRFWWRENGKRKSKVLGRFPTKTAAWEAAKPLRDSLEIKPKLKSGVPTVGTLVDQYRAEKMPTRHDTRAGTSHGFVFSSFRNGEHVPSRSYRPGL
jgi:hypothetical protein